jgi:hypothetical protein
MKTAAGIKPRLVCIFGDIKGQVIYFGDDLVLTIGRSIGQSNVQREVFARGDPHCGMTDKAY